MLREALELATMFTLNLLTPLLAVNLRLSSSIELDRSSSMYLILMEFANLAILLTKKLILLVPIALSTTISTLLARIEVEIPELHVAIELNSLEDAFVKIAEDELDNAKDQKQLAPQG